MTAFTLTTGIFVRTWRICVATLLVMCTVFAGVWLFSPSTHAAIPTTLSFQGRLTDSTGALMPDGFYNMQFKIYTVPTGGAASWSETREVSGSDYRVQVTNGLFSTQLGQRTALPTSLFANTDLYFEITMATPATATCNTTACQTWESPMTSRQKLATSAYAFNSDTLDGLDSTAFAAATGSANYIQNTSSPQTANFNITGTGTAGTLQTATLDTPTSGTLTIGSTNTTGIVLGKSTTIAANQSITLIGGTTATRPASPTEGMVYYDTDTKQLLTYANGKWQADRSDAILVAASNSSAADKAAADYVADGNTATANDGDQVQINQALTAGAGKKVVLLAGTYTVDASISIPNNTTIAGVGSGTVITIPNAFNANINILTNSDQTTGTNINVSNLHINGNRINQTTGSMHGLYAAGIGSGSGATAVQGINVSKVSIYNMYNIGVYFSSTYNSIVTESTIQRGIYLSGGSNISITDNTINTNGITLNSVNNSLIEGNIIQDNPTGNGIMLSWSGGNVISGNTIQGNSIGIMQQSSASTDNVITGNFISNNSTGVNLSSARNNISGNTITNNSSRGVNVAAGPNVISDNIFNSNGGSGANDSIFIGGTNSGGNKVTGNRISDSSCSSTCYGINISDALTSNNYLSDNIFGNGTIQDLGTNTIYANQSKVAGGLDQAYKQPNSTTAFQIQNGSGSGILTADTTNNRIVLGADTGLSMTGGSSRPASPTEGMVYYDTTTKQLLTYANGKWQSDAKTATKIVAASNSSQAIKDGADYVATGTSDQTIINTALTAAAGGKVYLAEGTYTIGSSISIPNNTILAGSGNGTIITIPNSFNTNINAITNTDVSTGKNIVVRDLRLYGNRSNQTTGAMNGIYTNGMGGGTGATARTGMTAQNISVESWYSHGIYLYSSNNSSITASTTRDNGINGIYLYWNSRNNTIENNITQGNVSNGIYLYSGTDNNTITSNTVLDNGGEGIEISGTANNVVSNNVKGSGSNGILFGGLKNSITNNIVSVSAVSGIQANSATDGRISGNLVSDSNGSTGSRGISVMNAGGTNIIITNNTIYDSSCVSSCEDIYLASATNTYLSGNIFNSGGINDNGTNTIYANQSLTAGGLDQTFKQANSSSAFRIQNSSGVNLFTADTTTMKITIANLNVTGTLTLGGHIVTSGTAPTIAAGAAACTTPTVSITGTDTAGRITVTTGTGCAGAGKLATITFNTAFGVAPRVTLTAAGANASSLQTFSDDATISTTTFDLNTNSVPANSTTYKWYYHAIQ